MRVIVPLQGVVQARPPPADPSSSSHCLLAISRSTIFRNGPARVSHQAQSVADPTPSAYYLGWSKCLQDPYDRVTNPNSIIQLGLAENRVSVLRICVFVVGFVNCVLLH